LRLLFTLFIVLPILEMVVLIKVGGAIGALATIGLVLLTAIVGVALLKRQGISALMRAQHKMHSGEMPVTELIEGIFLAVGGAFLLTPGFITDFLGFCCLIPGIRQIIIVQGLRYFKPVTVTSNTSDGTKNNQTIDGEFHREE